MNKEQTDALFMKITSMGCREMDEVRFHQAVNEAIQEKETQRLKAESMLNNCLKNIDKRDELLRSREKEVKSLNKKIRKMDEAVQAERGACEWEYDEYMEYVEAECGGTFCFGYDITEERRGYNFCPNCGRKIVLVIPKEEDEEEDEAIKGAEDD